MAEGKKTFVLHTKIIHTVEMLPVEKQGRLFMLILDYVNDRNPQENDPMIKLAFEPIKQQLKEDLIKWRQTCEKNKLNGSKGGRPRKNPTEPKKPSGLNGNKVKEPAKQTEIPQPKKSLQERKQEFREKVKALISPKYDRQLATDFFIYWSEHGENDKKMRFEREKPFAIKNRMHTFYRNKQKRKAKEPRM